MCYSVFMQQGVDYTAICIVTLCHDGEGNYLLGKRSERCRDEHLRWDLIGSGAVDFGEKLEDAIRREAKEEIGADSRRTEYLGFREVLRVQKGRLVHWIAFDFKVEVKRDQVQNMEPEKCLALEWYKLDDFPESMHSQWSVFYNQYKSKL